jgi:hypothetical protein
MTATDLDEVPTGDCTPDGGCAVIHEQGARMNHPAMLVPGAWPRSSWPSPISTCGIA